MTVSNITWTASNNNSFLNGERSAKTMRGAVIAARRYVNGELGGEGRITYYQDDVEVREDRIDMFTGYKWSVKKL